LRRKSRPSGLRQSGKGGGAFELAMWKSADTCEVYSLKGGLPVVISMTVQPTDQMSALAPWPVCLITSGAIQ
jgi:hypothetical protein